MRKLRQSSHHLRRDEGVETLMEMEMDVMSPDRQEIDTKHTHTHTCGEKKILEVMQ